MNAPGAAQVKRTGTVGELYLAFELGEKNWKLSLSDGERTAHINRIRALLVLQNLRVKYVGGRLWQRRWARHVGELLPGVRGEIERESEQLSPVRAQIPTIEARQRHAVAAVHAQRP